MDAIMLRTLPHYAHLYMESQLYHKLSHSPTGRYFELNVRPYQQIVARQTDEHAITF